MEVGKCSILPDQVYGQERGFASAKPQMHFNREKRNAQGQVSANFKKSRNDSYGKEMNRILRDLEIWETQNFQNYCQLHKRSNDQRFSKVDSNWARSRFMNRHNLRPDFFCQFNQLIQVTSSNQIRSQLLNSRKGKTVCKITKSAPSKNGFLSTENFKSLMDDNDDTTGKRSR